MGMDVYGANPVIRKQVKSKILKHVGGIGDDDWFEKWSDLSQEDKDKYSYARQQQEEDNPGIYFRNNAWWWRPLWDYVYSVCDDFINEDRWDGGHSNSGESFTDEEAKIVAVRLLREIKNNDTEAYERLYEIKTEGDKYQYPFSVDNVRNFAEFCKDSGGFSIQ